MHRLKTLLIVACLGLCAISALAGSAPRVIQGEYDRKDTVAINLNFNDVAASDKNSVHKTSTETITGFKYFTNKADFVLVDADTITLNGLLYNGTPVGSITMYVTTTTTPSGWLACNGQSVSTTTYAKLFAVTGYAYGGSGANFSVPDFRGVFPKGGGATDRTAGKDANGNFYSGTVGTYSTDKMQGHYHQFTYFGSALDSLTIGAAGGGAQRPIVGANAESQSMSVTAPRADGTNGTPRTGMTTEPQSLGVGFIIYAGI